MEDTIRLKSDILTMASVSNVDVDDVKLNLLLEDILSNYKVERKTELNSKNDILEKIEMFFIGKKLEGISENTVKGYTYELLRFSDFINKACSQITTVDIRAYLASYKNIKPSTLSTKITILRSFFGWLHQEEIILKNPTLKIKTPRKEKRLPKGLTIQELEMAREMCYDRRSRALLECFYSTGARLSELANLNIEDINFNNGSVNVIGKGNKERTIYLSHRAIFHLNKYLEERNDDCEALFVTVRTPTRRMTNRSIQREIDKIENLCKFDKKLTVHTLRHTFATLNLENSMSIETLASLMGHERIETTQIYTNVTEARKRQEFNRYHVQ